MGHLFWVPLHWHQSVVVRDGVVREDRCVQEGKVRHQAGGRKGLRFEV